MIYIYIYSCQNIFRQKRSDHGVAIGVDCPDKGIFVRLCFGYLSAEPGEMPPITNGEKLTPMSFAQWLSYPEEEKSVDYWQDEKKVRYKIWSFVIWLVKHLRNMDYFD
jgi:hypothetical protein